MDEPRLQHTLGCWQEMTYAKTSTEPKNSTNLHDNTNSEMDSQLTSRDVSDLLINHLKLLILLSEHLPRVNSSRNLLPRDGRWCRLLALSIKTYTWWPIKSS